MIYSSERPVFDMYTAPADQSAPASPFVVGDLDKFPGNFTPDGDTLAYQVQGAEGFDEAWKVSVSGGDPLPVHQPAFDVRTPLVSPDGRWLTYSSPTSGTDQVYLSPWAEPGERRIQLSVNGGTTPRWSRGGREIVYRQGDRMMAVEVDPETGEPGRPQALFEAPYQSAVRISNYDVTPDGERFLMVKRLPEQRPGRVVVVTNFFEELRPWEEGCDDRATCRGILPQLLKASPRDVVHLENEASHAAGGVSKARSGA